MLKIKALLTTVLLFASVSAFAQIGDYEAEKGGYFAKSDRYINSNMGRMYVIYDTLGTHIFTYRGEWREHFPIASSHAFDSSGKWNETINKLKQQRPTIISEIRLLVKEYYPDLFTRNDIYAFLVLYTDQDFIRYSELLIYNTGSQSRLFAEECIDGRIIKFHIALHKLCHGNDSEYEYLIMTVDNIKSLRAFIIPLFGRNTVEKD